MSEILVLQEQAEAKSRRKGHFLGKWSKLKRVWSNNCVNCGAEVRIHPTVHFGFSRIKGPAVNEYCFIKSIHS